MGVNKLFELLAEYCAELDRINRTTYNDTQRAAAIKSVRDKTRRMGHREIRHMVMTAASHKEHPQ